MIDTSTICASGGGTSQLTTVPLTDIAMLTCNRERVTKIAIKEIVRRTMSPYRLLIFDNGSSDDSPHMLSRMVGDELQSGDLYLGEKNNGVHWGHNFLLDLVTSKPYYVCTDNDIVPQSPIDGKDWLRRLIYLMEDHEDYAAIACTPHHMIGDNVNRMLDTEEEVIERPHIGAHLRIMRVDAVKDVGGWAKDVRPSRNHEERWICGRLRKAGWKVGYARDVRCIHLWGRPDLGEDEWGYTAGTYHEGHNEVWPPPSHYNWDRQRVDWETCRK